MSTRSGRWAVFAGAALSAACGEVPSPTQPGPPQPVIHLILVTNTADQVARIEYTTPADSVIAVVPRPVLAESVSLAVRTPAGWDVPLTPLPDDPSRYRFTLSISPGETYELRGSLAGRAIAAHTTVPGPLVVREPAGDTLLMPLEALDQVGNLEVAYAWHAVGATAYRIRTIGTVIPDSGGRLLHDSTGHLVAEADLYTGRPQPTLFEILALDSAAGAYSAGGTGNVAGALGLFGSASVLDPPKVVLWQ